MLPTSPSPVQQNALNVDNVPRADLAFAVCHLLDAGIIRPDGSATCWRFREHRFASLVSMIEQLESRGDIFWQLFDAYRAIANPMQR